MPSPRAVTPPWIHPPGSQGCALMLCPTDASLRGPLEPSLAWKALGRQLNAELTGLGREQLRRCSANPEQSGQPACREAWSSSLPRPGRSPAGEPTAGTAPPASPCSAAEGTQSTTEPQWPPSAPTLPSDAVSHCRQPPDAAAGRAGRLPGCLCPRGAAQGARVPGGAGK